MNNYGSDKIPFVDLFCGAGGLSAGFEMAGFTSVFANDNDAHACNTYALNHPKAHVFSGNVETLTGAQILEITGLSSVPLIIGGPNCQGVSLRGKRNPNDPKNDMFFHFKRLIEELRPEWFVMENVPGLLHRHNRELITAIYEAFNDIGYECGGEVLLAADYGVPQLRYRFILIGNRMGLPIVFPNATHRGPIEAEPTLLSNLNVDTRPFWRTVRDGISDLPPIENGGGQAECEYPVKNADLSDFQVLCRNGSDGLHNHVCHKSPAHNVEMITYIPQGGNWKHIPEAIRPERFKRVALKDHTTTYGRLRWGMPARTITTYFNNISAGAFTHPEQHRGISVREGARLQSFPDHFKFVGPLSRQYRQVGNAVPPLMASHVAGVIHQQMTSGLIDETAVHSAAVDYTKEHNLLRFSRPVQGMRFNLDKYLVQA